MSDLNNVYRQLVERDRIRREEYAKAYTLIWKQVVAAAAKRPQESKP